MTEANIGLRVAPDEGEDPNKMVGDRFSHVPDFILVLSRVLLKLDVLEQGLVPPRLLVKVARAPLGLPIGIHVLDRYGKEGTLFRLAAQLEEAAP